MKLDEILVIFYRMYVRTYVVGALINIWFNIIYFIWFVILLVFNIALVMNFWYIFGCIYLYFMHTNSIIYLFEMSQYLAMLLWRVWSAQNSCGPSLWRLSTKTVKQGVQRARAQSIPRPERTESTPLVLTKQLSQLAIL